MGKNSRMNDCRTQKSLKDIVSRVGQASEVAGDACQQPTTLSKKFGGQRLGHTPPCAGAWGTVARSYGGNLISLNSKKLSVVSRSSVESKYRDME